MAEPLVAPVSAASAGGSTTALSYVALRSHDGRRVILPVAAAAGSRVLHGLFQGICVMQLHQSATGGHTEATNVTAAENTLIASAKEQQQPLQQTEVVAGSISIVADEKEENGAASFHSYAAAFPLQVVCEPPIGASATTSSSVSPSPSAQTATNLLEVPIRSLETSTLARVAEFLVVKCMLASHPHYLHEPDVFSDLDRTSERDQLTAMQVLLGADFLNC